jgi:enoyl-CoA hydratase/carnithine racemase
MSDVRLELGAVSTITLDRPDAANALRRSTLDDLADAVARIAEDGSVRAVVVTGAGEQAFCAGADLKERAQMSDEDTLDYIRTIRDAVTAVERLPQPVVAAINGGAFGGGAELAMACDVRIMADGALIGLTETSLGIIPGGGGTQRLPRLVGRGRALELILSARRIDAGEALTVGLVHEVVPPDRVRARARETAERIASNAPIAVRAAKEAVLRGLDLPLAEGLALETELYERTLGTTDRLEGLTAFREKRNPVYRGE